MHGGGPAWMTGTYDPDLNLIYWGTGNPHPVLAGVARAGANLYTCSIVALNADTGKLVWYYQPSPHDTHDWDAVETPVLFDAEFHGRTSQAARASQPEWLFLSARSQLLVSIFSPRPSCRPTGLRGSILKVSPFQTRRKSHNLMARWFTPTRRVRRTGWPRASILKRSFST